MAASRITDAARAAAERGRGGGSHRIKRVEALIQRSLTEILAEPAGLSREIGEACLTVTQVEVAPDLSRARVWVLPLAATADGLARSVARPWGPARIAAFNEALAAAAGPLSRALALCLAMKRTPRLELRFDEPRLHARGLEARLGAMAEARARRVDEAEASEGAGGEGGGDDSG